MPASEQVHTVVGGDILSKIAKKYGVTVAAIKARNGIVDANRIFPGQKLVIPIVSATPSPAPTAPPSAPVPASVAGFKVKPLGELSKSYETSGRGPALVSSGKGDPGGISYGSYQMSTASTNPDKFLATEGKAWAAEFGGAKAGTPAFGAAWETIGKREPVAFHDAQHAFIQRTHYQVLIDKLIALTGIDLNGPTHSHALRDVAWSTAVHHGASGGATVFQRANDRVPINRNKPGYDTAMIDAVYAERGKPGKTTTFAYFTKVAANQIQGLRNRFKNERIDAQAMLTAELAAGGPFPEPGQAAPPKPAAVAPAAATAAVSTYPEPRPGIAGPVNTQLPLAGPGFVRYNSASDGSDRYGTTLFVKQIMQLAEAWAAVSDVPVAYGDMSIPGGAPLAPHAGHRRGDEVDIRPFRIDKHNDPMQWNWPGYDRGRTQALMQLIRKRHPTSVMFFNDPKLIAMGLCQPLKGHDNHVHLRIR